ncbi:carbohydrate ABC transporter permease [Actinocorallia longicatena]|uniref:Carbohydrate ABC transporter permease n=1 Tax=Actinocorallia longicatena TaxID=111803 RepID=A0ABP6QPG0_9ACTN
MSLALGRRAPAHAASARRTRRPLMARGVLNGLLAVFTVYTVMPLAWLVIAATKDAGDLFAHPGFALGDLNLVTNLRLLFTYDNGIYLRWFGNSFIYSVLGSLAGTMLSVMVGYAFDKYDFRFKEKLFGFILLGVLVPAAATQLPLYLMFSQAGLLNTYWCVLLPALVNPFGVYLSRVFSEGYVPDEVLEASRMDGAGEFTIFRRVSLPMLGPGFITIFLFSFTGSWNNFFTPLVMLSRDDLYPVNLGLYAWNSTTSQTPLYYQLSITGSLVAVIPLIVAFIMLQRFWKAGLTAGAVK